MKVHPKTQALIIIILLAVFNILATIYVAMQMYELPLGMKGQVIMVIVGLYILRKEILAPLNDRINPVVEKLNKGKGLQTQLDEMIPKEGEENEAEKEDKEEAW